MDYDNYILVKKTAVRNGAAKRFKDLIEENKRLKMALNFEPTDRQIASACMSFDHGFGLMNEPERQHLEYIAKEWLRAWQKEVESPASPRIDDFI